MIEEDCFFAGGVCGTVESERMKIGARRNTDTFTVAR